MAFTEPWQPHGASLRDYFAGDTTASLIVHSDLGEHDEQAVAAWFRGPEELMALDRAALSRCRGRVLDAGAGTGVHSLLLQERGFEVVAIDFVPEAVEIMRSRGVRDARRVSLFDLPDDGRRFDTILLLANGVGLAETVAGLDRLFAAFGRLLAPRGQVLLDSTDLRAQGHLLTRPDGRYVGEIQFQLEYQGQIAPPFWQLYVHPELLADRARLSGWRCEVVERFEKGHYLARLEAAGP